MGRKRTSSIGKEPDKHPDSYQQVFNEKGQRVRGLWIRGGRYFAQLDATDGKTYRYPLEQARTVPQAVLGRQALKLKQTAGQLPAPSEKARLEGTAEESGEPRKVGQNGTEVGRRNESQKPEQRRLKHAVATYQADRDGLKKKAEGTARREDSGLRLWVSRFGDWDLLDIKHLQLSEFGQWRMQTHKVGGRAVDLDIMALLHVYDFARAMELIPKDHPEFTWDKFADAPSKDELLTPEQADELCHSALLKPDALALLDPRVRHLRQAQELTGQAFHDFLRLLQYSGGREHETCLQEWKNVTWSRTAKFNGDGGPNFRKGDTIPGNLHFPGKRAKAGAGKPAEDRWVDFNDKLEGHLVAMYERRDPSSDWLFPGRTEGEPIQRFNKQLHRVKRDLRRNWEATVAEKERKQIRLFAVFHDSRREHDGWDDTHGSRGAAYATSLRGVLFDISDEHFELLHYACTWHTHGRLSDQPTIGTCWDADRLDLGRVGTQPEAGYMSTEFGREIAARGCIQTSIQRDGTGAA